MENKTPAKRSHIGIIVETAFSPGRKVLRGAARYAREHGDWLIFHQPRDPESWMPALLRRWRCDGLIARIEKRSLRRLLGGLNVPVVNVLGTEPTPGDCLVTVDNREIGRMGAEHLLQRGLREFGFVGLRGVAWSAERRDAFCERVRFLGCRCRAYHVVSRHPDFAAWEAELGRLGKWIAKLPRPCGIMVCNDLYAQSVLDACRQVGALVPEQIAVVGAGNDETICAICNPPLSTVDAGHLQVGYTAAEILHHLLNGEPAPGEPVRLRPVGVVTRQSTDIMAIEDPDVAMAVRFIHEKACGKLRVEDVADFVAVSKSSLQRGFQEFLGRSVHDEITRVRIDTACRLLAESDMTIGTIAQRTGFGHQAHMGVIFREKMGMTPGEYRRRASE